MDRLKEAVADVKADVMEIKKDIGEIKVTMGINTLSLETHIRRSDAMQTMLEEFQKHVLFVNTTIKVLASVGAVILFLNQLGLLKLF